MYLVLVVVDLFACCQFVTSLPLSLILSPSFPTTLWKESHFAVSKALPCLLDDRTPDGIGILPKIHLFCLVCLLNRNNV